MLCFGFTANAQRDVITTQAGEQIRCRILDETPTRFVYAYISKSGKVLRNEIFKSLVTDFKYNLYNADLVDSKGRLPQVEKSSTKTDEKVSAKNDKSSTKADEKMNQKTDSKKMDADSKVASKKSNATKTEADRILDDSETKSEKTEMNKSEERKAASSNSKKVENAAKNDSKQANSSKNEAMKTDEKVVSKPSETKKSDSRRKPEPRPNVEKQEELAKIEEEKAKKASDEKTADVAKTAETKTADSPIAIQPEKSDYKNHLKFRVGARGGIGGLIKTTALTDEYSKYLQGTEKGWVFGADAAFFPIENFGIGLIYNNLQTTNDSKSIKYTSVIDPTKKDITGAISDKTSTKFLGLGLYYRKAIDYKTFIVLGVAPGYNLYSNTRTEDAKSINIKGQQIGGLATLGVDFLMGNDIIGRDIILSLEGNYNFAKFDKLDYGDGKGAIALPAALDKSSWGVTIGLRFTRYPKYLRLTSY